MLCMKHVAVSGLVCAGLLSVVGCGDVPIGTAPAQEGSLEVQVKVVDALKKSQVTASMQVDSLVFKVYGPGMDTLRYARPFSLQQPYLIDTLQGIPAGARRAVEVFTVNKAGEVVQEDSAGVRTVAIDPNVVALLPVVLVPKKGSIYLQLTAIPTSVDSIRAFFTAESGQVYAVVAARSPKVFLSIDGISHNTKGVLMVTGVALSGDTLYRAEKEVVVDARALSSIELVFSEAPGSLSVTAMIVMPGITLATGSMGTAQSVSFESGELIVTEIMYAANDSEYIELFNPATYERTYDTLIVEVDGKERLFEDVTIGAEGYFVIGRSLLPWTDAAHPVESALDLSTTGNWIALKTSDGQTMDAVAFTGGSNAVDWPKVAGRQSIILDRSAYSPVENNFGRSWRCATTPFNDLTGQMGTPRLL